MNRQMYTITSMRVLRFLFGNDHWNARYRMP